MDIPTFETKEQLFKHLIDNKKELMSLKKAVTKQADSFFASPTLFSTHREKATKAESQEEISGLKLRLVINTTGILDSHNDVHIKGLWKKTLKEKKDLYLLQEHKLLFESIITDKVQASVKEYSWKDVGLNKEGNTEALIFDVELDEDRNPFMYKQYQKGYVKQHSVGMRYVDIHLCVNTDDKWAKEEKENWDKYISEVINKEQAEEQGYFWAVTQAKLIEGSAVVLGSNPITPTLTNDNDEPLKNTQQNKEDSREITINAKEVEDYLKQKLLQK